MSLSTMSQFDPKKPESVLTSQSSVDSAHSHQTKFEQSIQNLLHPIDENSPLSALLDKAKDLELLSQEVRSSLPSDLAHGKVAGFEKGILTLIFESASYATRCRFCVPQLMTQLRQNPKWCGLRSVQIKVAFLEPVYQPQVEIEKPMVLTISEKTADLLKNCADQIEDKGLKDILERMSKHNKPKD